MGFISKLYLHFNFSKFLVSGSLFFRVNSIKPCYFWFSATSWCIRRSFLFSLWPSAQMLLLSIEDASPRGCNQCLAHWIVSCRPHRLCSRQAMHIWIRFLFAPPTARFRILKSVPFLYNFVCGDAEGFECSRAADVFILAETHIELSTFFKKEVANPCFFASGSPHNEISFLQF